MTNENDKKQPSVPGNFSDQSEVAACDMKALRGGGDAFMDEFKAVYGCSSGFCSPARSTPITEPNSYFAMMRAAETSRHSCDKPNLSAGSPKPEPEELSREDKLFDLAQESTFYREDETEDSILLRINYCFDDAGAMLVSDEDTGDEHEILMSDVSDTAVFYRTTPVSVKDIK